VQEAKIAALEETIKSGHGVLRVSKTEIVCCLLLPISVTCTLQWIRQPKPREMRDVCEGCEYAALEETIKLGNAGLRV